MVRYIYSATTSVANLHVGDIFEDEGVVYSVTKQPYQGLDGHYIVPTDAGDLSYDVSATVATDIELKRFMIIYERPNNPNAIFQSVFAYNAEIAANILKSTESVARILSIRPI